MMQHDNNIAPHQQAGYELITFQTPKLLYYLKPNLQSVTKSLHTTKPHSEKITCQLYHSMQDPNKTLITVCKTAYVLRCAVLLELS